MPFERRFVLGAPVDLATEDDTLTFVRDHVEKHDPVQIVTVNAEIVMGTRRDPRFHSVIARAGLSTADGAGVVWALRRQGYRLPQRVGGSDLVWSISEQAAR